MSTYRLFSLINKYFFYVFVILLGCIFYVTFIFLSGSLTHAQEVERKTLELKMGGSEIIKTSHAFKRVSVADPGIADVVALSPKELYIYAKKVGYTSVILWEGSLDKTLIDVAVTLDLTNLKEKFHQLYPEQRIKVYSSETGIVLAGTVSGPEIVEQAIRLAQNYLPKEAEDTKRADQKKGPVVGPGLSGVGITNLLTVEGIQQVMLEVKFAEVVRESGKDWQAALGHIGLNDKFKASFGTSDLGVWQQANTELLKGGTNPITGGDLPSIPNIINDAGALAQNPGSLLLNFAGNAANIFVNIDEFTTALNLLEFEGLARILAEPRLVTQSGQTASFLAGGEFPVPVPDDDGIAIEYKEFGVALVFTPVLLSDGKISLRVAPSVSDITSTTLVPVSILGGNFIVPNLSTRKLETSVQLYDGQTLALAGLLQDNLRNEVDKIPGLGDVPVLGPLFRSSQYLQEKTDLLIVVTPRLVKPVSEGPLPYPGENLTPPSRYEFYLEGRLEGNRSSSDVIQGGLEGQYGYQPVLAQ